MSTEFPLPSKLPFFFFFSYRTDELINAPYPDSICYISPYIAQGAAQAVEDAASLGCVLSQISDRSQIPQALEIYEQSRKTRVEIIQRLGTLNRLQLHLPDGSDQIVRDRKLREADKPGRRSPDKWVDAPTQDFLCEWDAPKMVQHAWSLTDPYLGHVTANL